MSKRIRTKTGGGWKAVAYSARMARKAGPWRFLSALRRSNTCKTCALGMKGMRDELGHGFQVCKKAMQAVTQDLQPGIAKEFWASHPVDILKHYSGRQLEDLGRLVHPLWLPEGATHFKPIRWEEALNLVMEQYQKTDPARHFTYVSGRSANEAAFLIQLLTRQYGTNNINNCSYYCHQASGVGLGQTFGSGSATVMLEDVEKADLAILIGCNPSSNHPRFMTHLMHLRRRGGKVIVINPLKEVGLQRFSVPSHLRSLLFSTEIANAYIQPHCGGDLALVKAITGALWQQGKGVPDFLEKYCNNYDAWRSDIESCNPASLAAQAGVTMKELQEVCDYLTRARNVIFVWAMGVTHQVHGVDTVRAIANLALMLGQVGRPGAGMLPLRGHSNVQGVGTVGVVPKLKPQMVERITEHLRVGIPESPGYDTFASLEAAERGEVDFSLLLGGNLYGSNPDAEWAGRALARIPFTVQISTTMNLGHLHGKGWNMLILPVRTRDEERQVTTQESMFNFVRYSVGGTKPPAEDLPTEAEIICHIGRTLFGEDPVPWTRFADYEHIRSFIAKVVPGLEEIGKVQEQEFTIPGRIYHVPEFSTHNGKANLAVLRAPDARPVPGTFNLTTFRSEGQFNTIVYDEEDIYRGSTHRDVIFLHPDDVRELGIKDGDQVAVVSEVGQLQLEAVTYDIRRGNAGMFYPEGNALVPGRTDPQSKTPGFKRVQVKVRSV